MRKGLSNDHADKTQELDEGFVQFLNALLKMMIFVLICAERLFFCVIRIHCYIGCDV